MQSGKSSSLERLWLNITTNFGLKVISVGIAVLLWGVVLGSRSVEVTKEVPLEIAPNPDMIVANEIPDKIAFRISGPKAFLRAILDRREEPIRVNLAGHKPGTLTYRFFSDNIRVPIGVKVLSITPASIPIHIELMKRKEVPVRVELRGVPQDGFKITKSAVVPEFVRIKGAESKLAGVNEIMTTPIDVSGLHQTVEREVMLDLSRYNVQVDGPLPHVLIEVEALSANFRIKNVEVRVKSALKYRMDEHNVTVLVRADPRVIKELDSGKVFAQVDLSGRGPGRYNEPVRVTLPEGVGLVRVIPDRISVLLSQ